MQHDSRLQQMVYFGPVVLQVLNFATEKLVRGNALPRQTLYSKT